MPRKSDHDVDELAGALLQASRVLVGVAARSLSAVEAVVTLTQFRTLVVLETGAADGGLGLGELAQRLDVNISTAQRMVERLVRAGHVTRESRPEDRRAVVLGLTESGADLVAQVTRRRRAEIAAIVRRMPAASRADAVEALAAFADAAGEPAPPPSSNGTSGDPAWTGLL